MILDRVIKNREDRKNGVVKAIPCTLERFNNLWPGLLKGDYLCITGSTSSGKTTLMKKIAVIDSIEYAIQTNLDLKILYFGLEESEEQFDYTILAYLIYKKFKVRYNIIDFLSIKDVLPKEVLGYIKEVSEEFNQFKSYIVYHDNTYNPFGIYKLIRDFAETRGTFDKAHDEDENWSFYTPNNPNEFVIVVVDHLSLLSPETKHMNKLDLAMQDLSMYLRTKASKKFNYCIVVVHQQMAESEDLEHVKNKRWMPTLQGAADNKRITRDYLTVIGIGNPSRYRIKNHEGYEINQYNGYLRFIEILKQRYGQVPDRELPIFIDGKVNYIRTAPYPNQVTPLLEHIKTLSYV